MSLYQTQKCLLDCPRTKGYAPPEEKPDISVEGYGLDEADRRVPASTKWINGMGVVTDWTGPAQ
jgi:hypothetical protein